MQIKKEYKFYAGHRNQELNDKCFRPHGHDYKVFCVFNVKRTGSISTLFNDFDSKIELMLKDEYDHRMMIDKNDPLLDYFKQYQEDGKGDLGLKIFPFATSVENLCFYLFNEITMRFKFDLERIELQETRSSTVIYDKQDYIADKVYFNVTEKTLEEKAEESYQSLYEHLGYAAGNQIGYAVACEANSQRIRVRTQLIASDTYKGEVNTYPQSFLIKYFKV